MIKKLLAIGAMAIASLHVESAVPLAVGMTACVIGGLAVNLVLNRGLIFKKATS